MSSSVEKISVIIPTRNRAQSLASLLESLSRAEQPPKAAIEIIVVDNGSVDETANLLERLLAEGSGYPLQALHQPVPGKSNALNLALSHCDGDLLVIFDDDVIVERGCLIKLREVYRNSDFAAVQGRVLPGVDPSGRSAEHEKLREYNIPLIDYGSEIREIRGLTGTNMSFTREVFDAVGYFDDRLGPGAAGFSEDTEYSMRIRKAGFKIGYTPHAVVYHELNPNRYGRIYNREVEYRKGLSRSIYRTDSIAFKVLPNLVAHGFRLLVYRFLGLKQKAYRSEGRLYKCLGYVAGKWQRANGSK